MLVLLLFRPFHLCTLPPQFLCLGRDLFQLGEADPARFGLPGFASSGWGWIASQVVRDMATLNRLELLCWDRWALGRTAWGGLSDEDRGFLDEVARLTTHADNQRFGQIRALYLADSRLSVPVEALRAMQQAACCTGGP